MPRYQIIDAFVDSVRPWFDLRQYRFIEYLKYYGVSYDDFGQTSAEPYEEQLRFNVCEPIIDAAVNKVCKSRIVPMAITVGATYSQRQKAKKFNRFISGVFMESGVFEMDYAVTTESFVGDCAVVKVIEDNERATVRRSDPNHVFFDPEEAMLTGEVSVIVENVFVDRWKLIELLKQWDEMGKLDCDLKEAIREVLSVQYDMSDSRYFRRPNHHDVVMVREAWHAKSSPKANDGRHVVCLKGKMDLVVEDFLDEEVPHCFLTRKVPLYGITSPGLMCSIIAGQKAHDEVTDKLNESHKLIGVSRIVIRENTVKLNEVNDIPGAIITCNDPMADIRELNMQPAHPDVYSYRKELFSDLQTTSGVPDMSLSGRPPEGVTANSALSTLDDMVAEKLSQPLRCRERLFVKLGEKLLRKVKEISDRHGGKYVVKNEDGKVLEEIDFSDVAIPVGSYKLKCFPTNFLSQTPSVRYQRLSEMHQAGEISEHEWRSLSEIPDLERENDLASAPQDVVDMCIESILSDGKNIVAEAFDDHAIIVRRGMATYNVARLESPDPEEDEAGYRKHQARLKALANYINSASNWMRPPPAAPNIAGAGQPPPAPPPPTDMGMAGMVPPIAAPPAPPGAPQMNPFGPPGP